MVTKDEIQTVVREAILGGIAERLSVNWLYKYCVSASEEIVQLHQRVDEDSIPEEAKDAQSRLIWQAEDLVIQRLLLAGIKMLRAVLENEVEGLGQLQILHKLSQARRAELTEQALAGDEIPDEANCPDCGLCLLSAEQVAKIENEYCGGGAYPCCIDLCHCK